VISLLQRLKLQAVLGEYNRLPFSANNRVPAFQRTMDVDAEHLTNTYPHLENVTVCGKT